MNTLSVGRKYSERHEVGFLVGLLFLVIFIFMIFYYALPFLFAPYRDVQAETKTPSLGKEIKV